MAAVPPPKFKIEKEHLRKMRLVFIEKMDNMQSFIDHAMEVNLLRKEHKNEINSDSNVDKQTRKMLDFVEKKLPSRSNEFLKALIESGNEILAQKLVPQISISDLLEAFNVEVRPSPIKIENKYHIENFSQSRVNCINYMSDMPTFIDYALVINLLNQQHKNEILSVGNVDNQTRKLCDIMETKLPEKSDAFLYALTQSGNDYLVDLLQSEPGSNNTRDFSHLESVESVDTTRQEADCYPMERRGRVVILENVDFSGLATYRSGSEVDRLAVENFFGELNFEIIHRSNLTAENMENELRTQINDEKGYEEDCFILFIMSHGRESEIYGTDLNTMNYSVIFNEFNKCSIWNDKSKPKPKLIYIQACQPRDEKKGDEPDARKVSSFIDPSGHFYVMYATVPGGYAMRNTVTGSRLIQNLIKVYKDNYSKKDVETMGVKIKPMVYRICDSDELQIVLCHSSLPMKVFLGPA